MMPEHHNTDSATPLVPRVDGHDRRGRFQKGNHEGKGNPLAGKVAKLRGALLAAISDEDIKALVGVLLGKALGGDVQAAREILDRALGKPVAPIVADLTESEYIQTRVIFGPELSPSELKRAGVQVIGGPRDNRANA